MKLDERVAYLIAVGASVTANCQACLERNVVKARELGATDQEIARAVAIGKMVREGAAANLDDRAASLSVGAVTSRKAEGASRCCG